jgi:hypothetical protein
MNQSDDRPSPRPRKGRIVWIAGLALGVIAGIVVAVELATLSNTGL